VQPRKIIPDDKVSVRTIYMYPVAVPATIQAQTRFGCICFTWPFE